MTVAEALLQEFDREMGTTRQLLERIPDAKASWKPHPKSWNLGELSLHLANIPTWTVITLTQMELDMATSAGTPDRTRQFESTEALLADYDTNVIDARAAIAGTSDVAFQELWTLKSGGATIFSLPRSGVLRSFVLNHMIHHRGQLSVYLRMQDVPLPAIYGPSADSAG